MNISEIVNQLMAPLRQRVLLMIGRAVILAVGEDGLRLSLLEGEETEGVPQMQEYGFASNPLEGCAALAAFQGGNRDHGVVVATEDPRFRPQGLEPGETVIYTDEDRLAEGESLPELPEGAPTGWPDPTAEAPGLMRIHLKRGRVVEVVCQRLSLIATEQMNLCSPTVVFGPPGAQQVLGSETERVAFVGDCVDVTYGSSEGKHHIVESCE